MKWWCCQSFDASTFVRVFFSCCRCLFICSVFGWWQNGLGHMYLRFISIQKRYYIEMGIFSKQERVGKKCWFFVSFFRAANAYVTVLNVVSARFSLYNNSEIFFSAETSFCSFTTRQWCVWNLNFWWKRMNDPNQ